MNKEQITDVRDILTALLNGKRVQIKWSQNDDAIRWRIEPTPRVYYIDPSWSHAYYTEQEINSPNFIGKNFLIKVVEEIK